MVTGGQLTQPLALLSQALSVVLGHWHHFAMLIHPLLSHYSQYSVPGIVMACHPATLLSLSHWHSATQTLSELSHWHSHCHWHHSVMRITLSLAHCCLLPLSLALSLAVTRRVPLSELGCHYSQNSTTCGIIIVTTTGTYNQSLTAHYWHCKKHGKGPVASLLLSLPPCLSLGGLAGTLTIRSMAEEPGAVSLTHSITPCLPLTWRLGGRPQVLAPAHLAAALKSWRTPSWLGGRQVLAATLMPRRAEPPSLITRSMAEEGQCHSLTTSLHACLSLGG
jgi:hypothetical protein